MRRWWAYFTSTAFKINAVLLLPGTSGDRNAMNDLIGSGNAFDPAKHFIITPDPLKTPSSATALRDFKAGFC
ncbi:hypothetical protein CU669_08790 [Paramagnetospirillum kuznetsovii]|uniref:Uncharacterized protein n=2 Tax=Paramagnetospirillum kuznetsovii TaxID=2053833 RepID=A0A364NZ68_9PROT|nr:hypothetical protein CU669_08790 [Paramagnetospirillum kuznetsovii]